ncbi:hypothetical protein FXO38_32494 [Capsicum annuum]|uniref:RNase III domain-containing protein n=1 Tax=Capsicum annuum TaxID=4072 RepID=A0A2G2ZIF3_CAPAN|nr:hypothetical protein FXO37_36279 [Capsicum annuum]KAF3620201.1 hypothetical protein FXO38_32494 [Capsicum annuum]PHT81705.1 hypothetical protein T459_14720 [Capsicum annuum]
MLHYSGFDVLVKYRKVVALSFMKCLGVDVDFVDAPLPRHFSMNVEKLVNVRYLENLLHYKFNDPSLHVKMLTHGSYMIPTIPWCYQVLVDIIESLGGAIFVDSGLNKDTTFKCIRPRLEPSVIPQTIKPTL